MIKEKTQKIRIAFTKFSVRLVLLISLAFSLLFTCWAAIYTHVYEDPYLERLSGYLDSIPRNLLFFLTATLLLFLMRKLIFHGSEEQQHKLVHAFAIAQCLVTGLLLSLWVLRIRAVPMWDQRWIYDAVLGFMQGDYSAMLPEEYLGIHHHQYGIAFLLEVLFTLTGHNDYRLFQFANVLFIVLSIYFSYKLAEELFHNVAVTFYTLLLLLCCFPLYVYSTYIYGDVLTIMAGIITFWAGIRWCRTQKIKYAVTMIILMTIATLARKNALILILAVIIMLLIYALNNWNLKSLAVAALLLIIPLTATQAVLKFYEIRSGIRQENGIPSVMYISLGMQESENGNGVYSSYGLNTYMVDAGLDEELCTEIGKAYIRGRLREFLSDPGYTYDFYRLKILSQWNDQTFSSFVLTGYFEQSPQGILGAIYFEDLHNKITDFLNRYIFLVYLGISVCTLYLFYKRPDISVCVVFIAFVGGALFSILWEAKGRYVLPYVVFALPYAAMGIHLFQTGVWKLCKRLFESNHPFRR